MIERQESEHIHRLVGLANQLDRTVWSKSGFPQEERPDLDALLPKIAIDPNPVVHTLMHSDMQVLQNSPAWATMVAAGKAQSPEEYEVGEEKKLAQYNPVTRQITLSPKCFLLSEKNIKRIIAHELATDNHCQMVRTPYAEVSPSTQQIIDRSIAGYRQQGASLEGPIEVARSGAYESLLVNGYFVGRISGPMTESLNEIYPTIFELVTSELDQRGGVMRKFERDSKQGKLQVAPHEGHKAFATSVFAAMRILNWRILLHAFRQPNWEDILTILRSQSPLYGKDIFTRLLIDMDSDEKEAERELSGLMKLGYKNR
ncbi:MAG: hypothetical protein NUV98_03690 [Candidatus Roizmanbacteria bacterium]|nr:hypothetical protein [Candidatus Roizmanbacteria bacterium]